MCRPLLRHEPSSLRGWAGVTCPTGTAVLPGPRRVFTVGRRARGVYPLGDAEQATVSLEDG